MYPPLLAFFTIVTDRCHVMPIPFYPLAMISVWCACRCPTDARHRLLVPRWRGLRLAGEGHDCELERRRVARLPVSPVQICTVCSSSPHLSCDRELAVTSSTWRRCCDSWPGVTGCQCAPAALLRRGEGGDEFTKNTRRKDDCGLLLLIRLHQ